MSRRLGLGSLVVGTIFLIAIFLRFFRLPEYVHFMGDQGRDVLIVKRIIVDHKMTLLGPSASVGGFFIGPIYYYFMIPFLWLWGLNPVGPVVMTALFGLAFILLCFLFSRKFLGWRAAVVTTLLATLSPSLVAISRYSWNPNPVPFFSLALIISTYFLVTTKRNLAGILTGLLLGVLFQLHYTDLALLPVVLLPLPFLLSFKDFVKAVFLIFLGIFLVNIPFFLFEVRHDFINFRMITEFVTRRGGAVGISEGNFFGVIYDRLRRLFEATLSLPTPLTGPAIGAGLWGFGIWLKKAGRREKPIAVILGSWLIVGTSAIALYHGQLLNHYFNYLYPLPFLMIGMASQWLLKRKTTAVVWILGISVLLTFMITNLYLWQKPANMLGQTKRVDEIVLELTSGRPYNLALITKNNDVLAYRYFLELWGKSPVTIENPALDPARLTVTSQLLVICETAPCKPLESPLWEIADFGRAQIEAEVAGPAGIKIQRLIHYNDTNP